MSGHDSGIPRPTPPLRGRSWPADKKWLTEQQSSDLILSEPTTFFAILLPSLSQQIGLELVVAGSVLAWFVAPAHQPSLASSRNLIQCQHKNTNSLIGYA